MRRHLVSLAAIGVLLLSPVPNGSGTEGRSVEAASCTPGYKPCIPNRRTDVDCYGGSGDGPRYTKRGVVYRVKRGYDRYRLDADRDGRGCERR